MPVLLENKPMQTTAEIIFFSKAIDNILFDQIQHNFRGNEVKILIFCQYSTIGSFDSKMNDLFMTVF